MAQRRIIMAPEESPVRERIIIGGNHQIMTNQEKGLEAFRENCRIINEQVGGLGRWLPQLVEANRNNQKPTRTVTLDRSRPRSSIG